MWEWGRYKSIDVFMGHYTFKFAGMNAIMKHVLLTTLYHVYSTFCFSPFLLYDILQPWDHLLGRKRPKAKSGASWLESRNDLWQVVTDETKTNIISELLNHCMREREREGRGGEGGGRENYIIIKFLCKSTKLTSDLSSGHSVHHLSWHQPHPVWPTWTLTWRLSLYWQRSRSFPSRSRCPCHRRHLARAPWNWILLVCRASWRRQGLYWSCLCLVDRRREGEGDDPPSWNAGLSVCTCGCEDMCVVWCEGVCVCVLYEGVWKGRECVWITLTALQPIFWHGPLRCVLKAF